MESSTITRLRYTHLDVGHETGQNCFLSRPLKFSSHYHPDIDGLTDSIVKLTITESLKHLNFKKKRFGKEENSIHSALFKRNMDLHATIFHNR